MAALKTVCSYLFRHEAELAATVLAANQIRYVISGDGMGGWAPHLVVGGGGYHLQVSEDDLAVAAELLASAVED